MVTINGFIEIMRTINFKAKCLDNQEWICGFFYKENDNTYIIKDRQKECMLNRNIPYRVDPATVCQFTGFTDKNGKEIYEGDVLRSDEYPYSCLKDGERDNYYAVVYYCEDGACFGTVTAKSPNSDVRGVSDGIPDDVEREKMKNFEVVGNIHDLEWKQYGEYFQTEEEEEAER